MTKLITVPPESYGGQARVFLPNLIRYASNQVGTVSAALGEYLDNGRDAGATLLMVALYPDRVEIFDNGHGMLPTMQDEPYNLLQMYMEEVSQGHQLEYDVRDLLPREAGCSYRWLMECIAFSQKRPEKGERVIGMRGIGSLAFRHMGETPTWYSKPAIDLAQAFYGDGTESALNPPITILHAPTASALDRGDMSYHVEHSEETKMVDPLGKEHASGTKIIIRGLVPNIENVARPTLLAEEFRKRYGADIRLRQLKILVVDHLTAEGRKTDEGRIIEVEPLAYRGTLVFQEKANIRGTTFDAELYYDSTGKNHKVTLRRMGVDIDPQRASVTTLHGLSVEPFTTGKLSGFIELPNLPERVFPLDPAKTQPIASVVLDEYVKEIRSWRKRIDAAIEQVDARSRDKSTRAAMKSFSELAMDAVREVPLLRNLLLTASPRSGGQGRIRNPQVLKVITAEVLDEHNNGLEGITVALVHEGKETSRMTGARGGITFGRHDSGTYLIKVIVPEGMQVSDGISDYRFKVTEENPGFRATFHLKTGKPAPEQPERREIQGRITIWQTQLPDTTQPFSIEFLVRGQIHINTEFEEFRRALETNDDEFRDELIAVFVAQAIIEYTMRDYPTHQVTSTGAILAAKMLRMRRDVGKK